MALTLSGVVKYAAGNRRRMMGTLTSDAGNYTTGGFAFTPATVGMHTFDFLDVTAPLGYSADYDYTNKKIRVFTQGAATGTTAAAAAGTGGVILADGASGAGGPVQLPGTVASTTYKWGPLLEYTTATALPATFVMKFEAIGT